MIYWDPIDTTIVIAGGLAAMACAIPGVWLVLRRQSMMGDAISHTALPGVVIAVLGSHAIANAFGGATVSTAAEPILLLIGAVTIGVLTALLTEWVQKLGQVEASAALGVVFTSFFALGILLLRLKADQADLDPECVLFGQLELIVWDLVDVAGLSISRPFLVNGVALLVNLALVCLFFKELRISAFDPDMATVQGINARVVNYSLMAATAATVVLAFQSVGSILVIGLLIVPAATSVLLTDRLVPMFLISLFVAALSAALGHVLAITVSPALFRAVGFSEVTDLAASGMMAVVCGGIFLIAFLLSPTHGLVGKIVSRIRLRLRIAADDILSTVYRFEEQSDGKPASTEQVSRETKWIPPFEKRFVISRLQRHGLVNVEKELLSLTDAGRVRATGLIASHRLFESYMDKHFDLPADHLHETAHFVEHFLDEEMRSQIKDELQSPNVDPHGRRIPDST